MDLLGQIDAMQEPILPRVEDGDWEKYYFDLLDYELEVAKYKNIGFFQQGNKLDQLKSAVQLGHILSKESEDADILNIFDEVEEKVYQDAPAPKPSRSKSPSRDQKKPRKNARSKSPEREDVKGRRGVYSAPIYSLRKQVMPKICPGRQWDCEDDNMYVSQKSGKCECTYYRESKEICPDSSACTPNKAMVLNLGHASALGLNVCDCYIPEKLRKGKSEKKAQERRNKAEKIKLQNIERANQLAQMSPGERKKLEDEFREEEDFKKEEERQKRKVQKLLKAPGAKRPRSPKPQQAQQAQEEEEEQADADIRDDPLFKGVFRLDDHLQGGKRKSKRRSRSRRYKRR
jgi:hypothetical protein